MNRRQAREHSLQALYQAEFGSKAGWEIPLEEENDEGGDSSPTEGEFFSQRLFAGVKEREDFIDQLLRPFLKKGWALERLSLVDRSILRLAVYELIYESSTPPRVVINEAVDLAKDFGDNDSPSFINGVLGNFLVSSEGETVGLSPTIRARIAEQHSNHRG
ncbi:transcription antitermination factor NusB [Pasteuria penetrans]|uniref:transcription antitermination factor NusB n=1 Tax=Pasteuria penetrans TaxID=86005 RepID=UPI000FB4267E|nr:transcription antitermination factor NusB [Pasteuria penetrans]